MAVKTNEKDGKLVKGTSKADEIYNSGSQVSINGGAGNDYITNYGDNVSIEGGAGNDFIYAYGSNELILYSGGNDYICNLGDTDTLQIAEGTVDTLVKSDGLDYFLTVGENVITLKDAARSKKVNIVNAEGKKIKFKVEPPKFIGTDDNDYFSNGVNGATIDAGAGDDYIHNSGDKVTIDAGSGNDTIYNEGSNVLIKYSGGDDTINGFNDTSTLQITSGVFDSVISTNGSDYFLSVGENIIRLNNVYGKKVKIVNAKGKSLKYSLKMFDNVFNFEDGKKINGTANRDVLKNYGKKATVLGYEGDDTISNEGASSSLNGGDGNDSINNYGSNVSINGGDGDDTVYNDTYWNSETQKYEGADNVTIDGGKGNDYIWNYGSQVSIDGGNGNDSINNDGLKVTIDGGVGNDDIDNYGSNVSINGGAGNDDISGCDEKETLKGGKGDDTVYGYAGNDKIYGQDGNDYLYGGDGKDSLWGGKGNDKLWGGDGNDTFIFKASEATDTIFDYEVGDMLKILHTDGTDNSFKSSKYSNGDLTLAINGGGKVIFSDVSSDDTFNINGTNYKISGSKLKQQ